MASIRKEMLVEPEPESIWEAIRDVGAVHRRLAPGFVVDCRLEEDGAARVVTFANGLVAREVIVDVDDEARRVVWSATGERLTHHNASLQVFAEDAEHSQLVWIADLLPDKMKQPISGMIEQGMLAMMATLEAQVAGRRNQ